VFAAVTPGDVLLRGASGAGKALAARAIHGLSGRRQAPFVSHDAASLSKEPSADGGALFLREIGEGPRHLWAHLIDPRRSSLRLLASTSRPVEVLDHELGARFAIQIEVPGLDRRREDIPLLLAHLLSQVAMSNPSLVERYFERRDGRLGEAR